MSDKKYVFMTTAQGGWRPMPYEANDEYGIDRFIERNRAKDTYGTPNHFKEPTSNTKDNIAELQAIVIDIDDDHLSGGFSLNDARAFIGLLEPHFNGDIPNPYRVVYTGRGMHLYVKLDPCTDIAKYDLVSKAIFDRVGRLIGEYRPLIQVELKADRKGLGSWRFCRIAGTYNTEAHTVATEIYHSGVQYDIDLLIDSFIPELTSITKGEIAATDYKAINTNSAFKQYRKEFTAQSWRYCAIDDLKTLQAGRKEVRKINDRYYYGNVGNRNNMLFYFGVLCKWAFNDSQAVLDSMIAFNEFYGNSLLPDNEVMSTYNSVMKHDYKTPRASTMISNLGITGNEMKDLKVIIDKDEIHRRKLVRDRKAKATKDHKKALERRTKVRTQKDWAIELRASGMSYRDIAKTIGIGTMTAQRYCK